MTTTVSRLAACILTTLLAPSDLYSSAQAGDAPHSTIGWWSIAYREAGNLSGCSAASRFRDQTVIEMAFVQYDMDKKGWVFFISNPGWTWITRKSEHTLLFAATKRWNGKFHVNDFKTLWANVSVDFMNSVADSDSLTILNDNGTVLASLNMKDSRAAIRAVVNCVQEHPYTSPPVAGITVSGSGLFVTPNLLLTASHVVEECEKPIQVRFPERASNIVTIFGQDRTNDLVLLHTEIKNGSVAAFRLRPRLGEPVASYGFPQAGILSSSGNFTLGSVTSLAGSGDDTRLFQISAPIQPGNSGGPVLDMSANVIGMVVSQVSKMQNVNFAVQAPLIINFLSIKGVATKMDNSASKDQRDLSPPDVADIAKEFIVQVYCQKASQKTSSRSTDSPKFVAYNIADASSRFAGLEQGGISQHVATTRTVRLRRARMLHQLNEE
jgi:serine protease Do